MADDINPLDIDARWAAWGQTVYGRSGRRLGRELQGLVRDTVHDERVRMDARAEQALADVREAMAARVPTDCSPGFAARRKP